MKIDIEEIESTYIAKPSIIVHAGRIEYTMNFEEESDDNGFGDYDPDYSDMRERAERREANFDE